MYCIVLYDGPYIKADIAASVYTGILRVCIRNCPKSAHNLNCNYLVCHPCHDRGHILSSRAGAITSALDSMSSLEVMLFSTNELNQQPSDHWVRAIDTHNNIELGSGSTPTLTLTIRPLSYISKLFNIYCRNVIY